MKNKVPKQVEALTKISEAAFIPQSGAITSLSMTFASIRHFLPLSLSLSLSLSMTSKEDV
jgi:hypothetical protein